ncbi:MAG: RNase adapter RapZ [Lachnospiraceae bacterium]|nr:RNase adapter RapZ [Lachnospiraceae bacterium]
MRFVIVTGMSGAGKSTVLKCLEDIGYFCVDNMPVPLVRRFVSWAFEGNGEEEKVAIGVDVRSGKNLPELAEVLAFQKGKKFPYEILFLDATDEILIKRYKETRRNHPLAVSHRIDQGIRKEREALAFLKKEADYIIDTSHLLTRDLRTSVEEVFGNNKVYRNLFITVLSFGFKYGIPGDADLVFDVRFMPNPYYEDSLRMLTGNDKAVQDYVMKSETSVEFVQKLTDMMEFLIPNYVAEGKNQLVICIGCTGGKHRSVTVANALYERLRTLEGIGVRIEHRDIDLDAKRKGIV